ncbi:MAG: amidase [Gemmatimonadota bacterium]
MSLVPRRSFVASLVAAGAITPTLLLHELVRAQLVESGAQEITPEMILAAAAVAGLALTREQAEAMVEDVVEHVERYAELEAEPLGNDVPLPIHFDPRVPGVTIDRVERPVITSRPGVERPADLDDVAFWPITRLALLVETRQVTSAELTELYLRRLRQHGPTLECVVTLTEARARASAARADAEIAAGGYRGPLHGLPYGVKDIIAVRGYPTTWGAAPYREQVVDVDATVVQRLDEAGAVLVAKLTTGELAFGDRWFGGRTNNPWNPEEGSSGSSAGSAAATAAGLVAFAIGTDTGGSILSPAERCGIIGLRPTFGRVSRHGVMAAGTSLDKIGPLTRTAEDAAIVLHAIAGPDELDLSVPHAVPVHWDATLDTSALRVGYHASTFAAEPDAEYRAHHARVMAALQAIAGELRPVELPPSNLNFFVEFVERAAGFEDLVRSGRDAELQRPVHGTELRAYSLVPAVAYLQANRMRYRLMQETHAAIADVNIVLGPRTLWDPARSLNPLTSLTGHPVVAVPTGLGADGAPLGITLMGRLYREGELLAVAQRLQEAMGFPTLRPPLFS